MADQPDLTPTEDLSLPSLSREPLPPASPPRLLLSQSALHTIREHGYSDTSRECAGVLVGEKLEGEKESLILVEAAIAGAHTDSRRGSVTFTHDTWEQIYREKDQKYEDLRIVGWYHTHPGFGIFLSEYDEFIQKNFFDLPWNVAFVLDPLSGEAGAFGWQAGQIARLPGYEVYGKPGRVTAEPLAREVAPTREVRVPVRTGLTVIEALIIVVCVAVLAVIVAPRLLEVGRPPAPPSPPPPVTVPAPPSPPAPPAPAAPAQVWHTVEPGDTLWKVAEKYYGRGDMWGLIAAANGLVGRETALNAGMKLLIPLPPGEASGDR